MKFLKKYKVGIIILTIITILGGLIFINNLKPKDDDVLTNTTVLLPQTYNVAKGTSNSEFDVLTLISGTLTTLNESGKVEKYGATDLNLSKDLKKLTITINPNLKYENGDKIVAQDYISSMKMLANAKTKSMFASFVTNYVVGADSYYNNKANDISGIKLISDTKFEINFIKPCSFYDSILAKEVFAPVQQKNIDKNGGVENYGKNYKDILSSGEYKITKVSNDQFVELEKNENFSIYNSKTPKKIKIKKLTEAKSGVQLFLNNELNSLQKTQETQKLLGDKEKNYKLQSSQTPIMKYMETSGLDKDISRAMYLAIDKNYIIQNILKNKAKLVNSLVPENYKEVNEKLPYLNENEFDLNKAKQLINNRVINIRFMTTTPGSKNDQIINKYLMQQWKKIGLNVTEQPRPMALDTKYQLKTQNEDRDYEVTLATWGPDYNHESAFYNMLLGSKTNTSFSKWTNQGFKNYDEKVKQALISTNRKDVVKLYQEADKIRHDEGKLQTLYESSESYYIRKNGYIISSQGQMLKPNYWKKV